MVLVYIVTFLFFLYTILILWYWRSWNRLLFFSPTQNGKVSISVVIAARNEEDHVANLLKALSEQSYPSELFEVIVVDDGSTDGTAKIIKQFPQVRLLKNPETARSHKKEAIATGVNSANGELIVTTDADCIPPAGWLACIASFYESTDVVAFAAPVLVESSGTFIEELQSMDFLVLQGITGATLQNGSMIMANGANLIYKRTSFETVGGFSGIDKVASGDDMLLLYKISKAFPSKVKYLLSREAIVRTSAVKGLRSFLQQRMRWAGKSLHYDDQRILPVLVVVLLVNLSFPALLVAGFFNAQYWLILPGAWIFKTLVELPLFIAVSKFFMQQRTAFKFFLMQPFHICYTIVVGLFSQVFPPQWKGRKLK